MLETYGWLFRRLTFDIFVKPKPAHTSLMSDVHGDMDRETLKLAHLRVFYENIQWWGIAL